MKGEGEKKPPFRVGIQVISYIGTTAISFLPPSDDATTRAVNDSSLVPAPEYDRSMIGNPGSSSGSFQ